MTPRPARRLPASVAIVAIELVGGVCAFGVLGRRWSVPPTPVAP